MYILQLDAFESIFCSHECEFLFFGLILHSFSFYQIFIDLQILK